MLRGALIPKLPPVKDRPKRPKLAPRQPPKQPRDTDSSFQPEVTLSRGRLWLFRFLALLLPVIALIGLELALRLAGYGYSTSFFKEVPYGGKRLVVDNEFFSRRFFPPELARWPTSFKFELIKPPDTTRIFILGESAAMGDPR